MKIQLYIESSKNSEILVHVTAKRVFQKTEESIIISKNSIKKIEILKKRFNKFLSRPDYRSTSSLMCSGILSRSKRFRYLGAVKPHINNLRRELRFYGAIIDNSDYVICRTVYLDINYITLPGNFFSKVLAYAAEQAWSVTPSEDDSGSVS